jgi:hypothetical protein
MQTLAQGYSPQNAQYGTIFFLPALIADARTLID